MPWSPQTWTRAGLPRMTVPLLALQAPAVPAVHQGSEGPPGCTTGASAGLGGRPSHLDVMWVEPPPACSSPVLSPLSMMRSKAGTQ